MRVCKATPTIIQEVWAERSSSISTHPYVADVADVVVDGLYKRFEESLVMVRAFLTIPFQDLPERQSQFAMNLAASVQLENQLGPYTPVHSLIATRGCVSEWNDPRKSVGHVAIPLLSEAFVSSIPMMSRLLKELGLPLTWVQDPGPIMERQAFGSEVGFFFVADPGNAIDELGRKIIPAEDFISSQSVGSVFAVGGSVYNGAVLVLIFFNREPIDSLVVRAFMPLINHIKGFLISQCSMSRIFKPGKPFESEEEAGTKSPYTGGVG